MNVDVVTDMFASVAALQCFHKTASFEICYAVGASQSTNR